MQNYVCWSTEWWKMNCSLKYLLTWNPWNKTINMALPGLAACLPYVHTYCIWVSGEMYGIAHPLKVTWEYSGFVTMIKSQRANESSNPNACIPLVVQCHHIHLRKHLCVSLWFKALVMGLLWSTDKQHVVCCVSLQTAATVTAGCVSVMKAGSAMPASSRRSVTYPARKAKSFAKTRRGWSAPTEVLWKHINTRQPVWIVNERKEKIH